MSSSPSAPKPAQKVVQEYIAPRGEPTNLQISRTGTVVLDKPISGSVGLDKDGWVRPADDTIRWYKAGTWPRPGYPGPAVLSGHSTFAKSEGVLWELKHAREGDLVTVSYSSGDAVVFRVTRMLSFPKSERELPVADIWPSTSLPMLRICTCDTDSGYVEGSSLGNTCLLADDRIE